MSQKYDALSEREKDVLRLILHGHDAKSMARELGLSVHTVNEYLRGARRKMEVTSSKEAARLLLEAESGAPQFFGHRQLGSAPEREAAAKPADARAGRFPARLAIGAIVMTILLAALTIVALPQQTDTAETAIIETQEAPEAQAEAAARRFVEHIDAGDWRASYDATSDPFHQANTLEMWSTVSQQVRAPLGAVVSRKLRGVEMPPTPQGYRIVTFDTRFADRAEPAVETVSMVREDGAWKVAGIFTE
ncbi:DUF4019 domain-containing protein [Erythrobacteraceae bacterium WH01K]|nr:DUF4019 domain-containing protein [Erythrobacteraceae bacterium WH01K]